MTGRMTSNMSNKLKCPICEKRPAEPSFKPFCSKRCADVDLSRWLTASYTIAGNASDEADDSPSTKGGHSD